MASVLRAQYGARIAEIVGSDEHTNAASTRREFLRGEARAFVTALKLPDILLETAESDLQLKLKLEEISNASRSTGSDTNSVPDDGTGESVTKPDWSDAPIDD